jgi:hypothetical protein
MLERRIWECTRSPRPGRSEILHDALGTLVLLYGISRSLHLPDIALRSLVIVCNEKVFLLDCGRPVSARNINRQRGSGAIRYVEQQAMATKKDELNQPLSAEAGATLQSTASKSQLEDAARLDLTQLNGVGGEIYAINFLSRLQVCLEAASLVSTSLKPL